MEKLGHVAFIIGVLIAILSGLLTKFVPADILMWILVALGLIVGFLNVTEKESTAFLVATIALMSVGGAGLNAFASVGSMIEGILKNLVAFVAPAALVVALKAVYAISATK
ncbi:MAG: hypothetical protein QS98_C0012G0032 [archaeon GW2011_AR3]|nr:MAG: hypothetical protein QS98_C0012G0032 [archaeon GW2011_AR3]MBS3109015.1 hypothetical protein [Candidatus Woesearchaeota archaeon]